MQPVQYNQFFDERPNTTPQAPTELLSIKPICTFALTQNVIFRWASQ